MIYIDSNFCCHTTNPEGNYREIETDAFRGIEGRCDAFIEGFRFIPAGESWTREDGEIFEGPMLSPWKDMNELHAAQLQHELAEYENLVNELYTEVTAE